MYEKKKKTIDDDCPICGGKIWKGQKVLIEGAKMTVCQNCAQYGKKIISKPSSSSVKNLHQGTIKTKKKTKQEFRSNDILEPKIQVVPDFANKIRNARMKNNLNQDQFAKKLNEKPSLIRRIETGKVEPTIKLAEKMEKVYNIKLLEKTDKIEVNTQKFMKKQTGSSLGDIAFIKKKE